MLKVNILKYLNDKTENYIKDKNNEEYTAQYISDIFGVKRNTISHYINQMIDEGKVIKINTRPVYFFHKDSFERRFFKISKNTFSSIEELFNEYSEDENKDDIFKELIGYNGSLSESIDKIKTSVLYPTENGLPIMLSGPTGVGKSFIADLIYQYSIEQGVIKKDAPFIIFNCAQYYNNPELLSSNLFGYVKGAFTGADKSKAGMIEAANGGILFLDEVHRLNSEGQEKLFTFMDKGLVRRMGETDGWHKSNVRLVFATTESLSENFLETFLRRVPITINIPGLNDRDILEKMQFVYTFLINESKTLNKDIIISQRALDILASYSYKGNVGELKNTIKYICAYSYSKNITSDKITIKLKDLPETFLRDASIIGESKIKKKGDILISPNSNYNELFFSNINSNNEIKDLYRNIFTLYRKYKYNNDKEQFEKNIFLEINSFIDKIIFDKSKINENIMLQFIISSLQDVFKYIENNYNIRLNANCVYTMAYFIYSKGYENIKFNKDEEKLIDKIYKYALDNNKEEFKLVSKLSSLMDSKMDVNLQKEDEIFISFYFKSLKVFQDKKTIKSVILAHGYSTASSISSVANRILESNLFEAFDMPIDISVKEIGERLIEYINRTDITKGLIILVDMGSLKDIHNQIKDYINYPIAIINNVSTQIALYIGSLLNKDLYIEEVIEKVKEYNETEYKIIYPEKVKEKAIITSSITGIGTSKQIQKLLEKSIPKELGINIVACDYARLKNDGVKDTLFQMYDVLAIISTLDPEVSDINYISLDDLISGRGEEQMKKIFNLVADENTIITINNNLVRNLSLETIVSSVTILDSNKILENVEKCLNELEILIGKRIPNDKKVTLYIHISCLVERLIRKVPIENYNNLDTFIQCQENMIKNIKKAFSGIEETYNVKINIEEVGYVYDIITAKTEALNEF